MRTYIIGTECTSNINSRVPETMIKIIEETVREGTKNMANTLKGIYAIFII